MLDIIKTILIVHGDVQSFDYRGRVASIAKRMGITGTIQNLSNGNVKIVAEGESQNIERFCDEIKIRNYFIKVTKIERGPDLSPAGEYETFYNLVGEGEIDIVPELIRELSVETKNGFKDLSLETKKGFKDLKEYNIRIDSFITRLDSYMVEQRELNTGIKKILEKLVENK